ncbi:hypothetical protein CIK05_12040 [Bdellovibrio sp. qaytius]|nr:hypothetical protein CIK05_12040 [Bdellovibrio sp. qaytius]
MNKKLLNIFAITLVTVSMQSVAFANDETMGEKASEAAQDTGKAVKKGVRKVKDKTCHMVKGKMQCAAEKMKHKAENVSDEVKDKVEDIKK